MILEIMNDRYTPPIISQMIGQYDTPIPIYVHKDPNNSNPLYFDKTHVNWCSFDSSRSPIGIRSTY